MFRAILDYIAALDVQNQRDEDIKTMATTDSNRFI